MRNEANLNVDSLVLPDTDATGGVRARKWSSTERHCIRVISRPMNSNPEARQDILKIQLPTRKKQTYVNISELRLDSQA